MFFTVLVLWTVKVLIDNAKLTLLQVTQKKVCSLLRSRVEKSSLMIREIFLNGLKVIGR